jgi:hypothetical protein
VQQHQHDRNAGGDQGAVLGGRLDDAAGADDLRPHDLAAAPDAVRAWPRIVREQQAFTLIPFSEHGNWDVSTTIRAASSGVPVSHRPETLLITNSHD